MDDRYTIDTPEHITFDYDVAGIGSRFLAALIDNTILGLLIGVLLVLMGMLAEGALSGDVGGLYSGAMALLTALNFLLFWGYFLFFEVAWNGQTPGKRVVGLRVVRDGGRPITLAAAAVRNLVRFVDFLPLMYGVGVVAMFVDARSRRLGDLAAGTLVVKDRRAVTLESLAAPPYPQAAVPELLLPNMAALSASDYNLVQEFLQRRATLAPEVRARLAARLATQMRARLALPPDEHVDHERLLQQVALEYAAARRGNGRPIESAPAADAEYHPTPSLPHTGRGGQEERA
jgi:uncharacterized RDD family membrane protein YckC